WAGGFQRPAFLSPQDTLFTKMATVYYQNIKSIYGDYKFFGGDPFHEGGNSAGLDVALAAKTIQQQMQSAFSGSTWVLQAWGGNPSNALLNGVDKAHTLVIDLFGENQNNWEKTDAYNGTPWIWCSVNNFGDKPGMYGKLQRIVEEPRRAFKTPQGKLMRGVGIIPEGVLNNPLLYNISLISAWNTKSTDSLLRDYMLYRYGKNNAHLLKALQLLKQTVYVSHVEYQEGSTESIFAARPAKEIKSVSSWGTRKLFYDNKQLEEALKSFAKVGQQLKGNEAFKYDISDIARQVVANRGQMTYDSTMKYFNRKDLKAYQFYKNKFFKLMRLQEELMASNKNFLLGRWLEKAKSFGETPYEKELSEINARMQITIWGPDEHDYAHKEWAGLIKDLYLPRWKKFFEQLDREITGIPARKIDFFAMDLVWVKQRNSYATLPKGNFLELINKVIASK
ncbi:MAG: hypothetical protein EOO87_22125, partial [Pedobacter sp.]